MEDKYIIDNNLIWEMIKDQFEETGEIIDNMKVYRLKKPITQKEKELLDKSKSYIKRKLTLKRLRRRN